LFIVQWGDLKKNILDQFVYGMGSFFNIFNAEHKKCFKHVVENNIKIHSSIYYPGSSFFLKKLTTRNERKKLDLIIKIAGYNYDQFRYELDKSIKEFDIDNFYGIQFWDEVPTNNKKEIDYDELFRIIRFLEDLKKTESIKKIFLQIRPNQFKLSETKLLNYFDGFAFYAYPNEAQLEMQNYNDIYKNQKIFLQLQFFGGRYNKNLRDIFIKKKNNLEQEIAWIKKCANYSIKNFSHNSLFVGSTRNFKRLKILINILKENELNMDETTSFSDKCTITNDRDYSIDKHKKNLKLLTSKYYLLKQYFIRLIKSFLNIKN